jgi:hypothetical protein
MTTPGPALSIEGHSQRAFRLSAIMCAVLLAIQSLWLIFPELARPGIDQLPTSATAAAAAAKHHGAAVWAASVAGIRGDLWAEAAFTEASLLWRDKQATADKNVAETIRATRATTERALRDAPHRSDAWLLLAGLLSRFGSAAEATEPLRMSYYTGPSDQGLMPLRLSVAIQAESFDDPEMRQLVSRDIGLLLSQEQSLKLAEIYNAASQSAKSFMQEVIRDIDPSALDKISKGAQKQLQLVH